MEWPPLNFGAKRKWSVLLAVWVTFFASTLSRFIIPALLPIIQLGYGLSSSQAGLLVASYWMTYAGFQIPAGLISDRFGAARTNYSACAVTGVACVLGGFSQSYIQLVVLQLVMGFSAAFVFSPGAVLIFRSFEPNERASAVGLFQTGFAVAATFSFLASALLAAMLGPGAPFWAFGAFMMTAAIFGSLTLRQIDRRDRQAVPTRTSIDWGFLKNRLLWYDSLARFGSGVVYLGSAAWVTSYLYHAVGLSLVQAGIVGSAMSAAGIVGYPVGGIVADKVLRKRAPVVLLGTLLLGVLAITLALSGSLLLTSLVAFVGMGFSFGFYASSSVSVVSEFGINSEAVGSATSFVNFMAQVPGTLSPALFGFLLEMSHSYDVGWMLLGTTALACSVGPALLTKRGY